jgi:hypothetical protein
MAAAQVAKQPDCEALFALATTLQAALMVIVLQIVSLTPVGIGSLIAAGMGKPIDVALAPFVRLFLGAQCAFAVHFALLTAALALVGRRSPRHYYARARPAFAMAFGTDSSAAVSRRAFPLCTRSILTEVHLCHACSCHSRLGMETPGQALPTSMACAHANLLRKRTVDFVLPLGASVNMDGSAIYYVMCVIFIAGASANPLDLTAQIKVGVVGALVTCGAAPVREPGSIFSVVPILAEIYLRHACSCRDVEDGNRTGARRLHRLVRGLSRRPSSIHGLPLAPSPPLPPKSHLPCSALDLASPPLQRTHLSPLLGCNRCGAVGGFCSACSGRRVYMIMHATAVPTESAQVQSLVAVVLTMDWLMVRAPSC